MNNQKYNSIICEKLGSINTLKVVKNKREMLQKNQVRIKVKACGINFPDKLMVEGKYQLKPPLRPQLLLQFVNPYPSRETLRR